MRSSEALFEDVGITYFYFKHNDRQKSNEDIARILLSNLVSNLVSKKINIVPALQQMLDAKEAGNPPKFNDIVNLIISFLKYYASIFVFFDALDESTEEQKDKMLDLIKRLCDSGMRVFLTSQTHLKSRVERLCTIRTYEIKAQKNDLEMFIGEELRNKFDNHFPHFAVEDKEKIRKSLIDNADGRYIQIPLV